jgi:hypothetical protein
MPRIVDRSFVQKEEPPFLGKGCGRKEVFEVVKN